MKQGHVNKHKNYGRNKEAGARWQGLPVLGGKDCQCQAAQPCHILFLLYFMCRILETWQRVAMPPPVLPYFCYWLPETWHGLPVLLGMTVPSMLHRDLFKALSPFVLGSNFLGFNNRVSPVSYTHLTLPTKRIV